MLTADTKYIATSGTWQRKLMRLEGAVARSALLLAAAALIAMVLLNAVNVVCRYLFAAPLSWSDEAMTFLMAFSVFLGAIFATREGTHIRIDIFVSRLSQRHQRVVSALTLAITIVVLCVLGHVSYTVVQMLAGFDQRSDALELPIWIVQATVPLALFTSALLLASRLVVNLLDRT